MCSHQTSESTAGGEIRHRLLLLYPDDDTRYFPPPLSPPVFQVELPAYTEEGLRATVFKENYKDLKEYLSGFPVILRVMQQKGALERIAYE